jgi:hypothetical protein
MDISSSKGFSLVETIVSLGVLTTGVLGTAAVLTAGMQNLSSSPADVVVTNKANEAIEAVFSARDARKLTWTQINNTSVSGGIFLVGPQQLKVAGNDGLVNTADDGAIETVTLPGKDQTLGTADDTTVTLSGYTREIQIQDVPGESSQLRTITVIIKYKSGPTVRTYTLMSYLSAYS